MALHLNFLTLFLLIFLASLVYCHNPTHPYQEECPVRKNEVDYKPKGRHYQLGNLSIYETLDTTPKRLLIAAYDIFGDTDNTKLFADMLAESYGFRIVVPDFYRGEPWDHNKWPPNLDEYAEWQGRVANWDTIVQYDVQLILDFYWRLHSIKEVGIFGFCWGGMVSTMAATHMPTIKAAGLVHPSSVTLEMVQNVNAPMYLFPCLDDPDLLPYYELVKQKFGDNSGHRRYTDMCHGFATSMGNFSDPLNMQRVEQTIDILGNFFVRNLQN